MFRSKKIECRDFEITIISAHGLESVRKKHRMEVYAKVFLGAEPETEKRTPVDKHGDRHPAWKFPVKYTIGEPAMHRHGLMVDIRLYCRRAFRSDKYIGEVHIPIKELFDHDPYTHSGLMTEPVRKGCSVSEGSLKFSYWFGMDTYSVKKPSSFKKGIKFVVAKLVQAVVCNATGYPLDVSVFI